MKSRTTESADHTGISRRDFFAGAGMAAGAVATIGGIAGTAFTPAAQAAVLKDRKYFSTYVALEFEGAYAGNLVSAEGGEPVIVPGSPDGTSPATVRYEPLRLRLGDMSGGIFKWMGDTSRGMAGGKSVSAISYDIEGRELYRLAAENVRPISIMTDNFDAGAKDLLRFEVLLQPGFSRHVLGGKANAAVKTGLKSKAILRSNFRLYVQGLESMAAQVRSVESFGLKARPDGVLVPTPLRFTLIFKDAAPLFAWMQNTLEGKEGGRPAQLQILSSDMAKVMATADFNGLTMVRISCPAQSSGGDTFQHVEVECQPSTLAFNMGELQT